MFAEYKESIVAWLKDHHKPHGIAFQTCRQGRKTRYIRELGYFPSGIVDLCPCIKLTIGRKRAIEAWLQEKEDKAQYLGNQRPAAGFWWHTCRHTYGDIEIQVHIGIFLYDGTERRNYTFEHETI